MNKKRGVILAGLIVLTIGTIQLLSYDKPQVAELSVMLSEGSVAYERYGSGPPLIAIHGSPGTRNDFRNLGPLIENHTVYAPDMYCFGESSVSADCGIDGSARTLEEFMNALNISRAVMLGYSWGGGVAIEFAYRYPERVTHLILLDSMGIPEGEITGSYWGERIRIYLAYPFVVFYPGVAGGNIEWRRGFMRSYLDTDLRPLRNHLQHITVPTLIVHGAQDTVVEPWVAEEHHRLIPHAELVWFTGGHGKLFSDAREIARLINRYVHNENA